MNIQQFQYVVAVVDLKNFELAADQCSVTQSTLSTMIGRLEDELGIKIFNRKTKPVSVTTEGEQLIIRLRVILNEIDVFNNVVQELKGEMSGEFRIGVIPTIAPYLLPLILNAFTARFPLVKIIIKEMTTAEIQKALKVRSLDVGILALPLLDNELVETELYSEPFLVYDCTGTPHSSKVSMSQLDYSKICLLEEGHCLRNQVEKICELSLLFSKTDHNFSFDSGSMDSLLRITNVRKALTIIPYLASIELSASEIQKLVGFDAPVPVRQVGLVTHKFFVKKKLFRGLEQVILQSVTPLLPIGGESKVLDPL